MKETDPKVPDLAARNALLEATFEAMGEAICILDLNHRLISWNQRYVELRGVPAHLAKAGTDIRDILRWQAEQGDFGPGAVDEIVAREFADAWSNLPSHQQLALASGRIITVRRYRLDGLGYVTIADDVTERVRTESDLRQSRERHEGELRRSEQRLALHIENTPIGVIEWDADAHITAWNKAAQRIFGYTASEVIGRSGPELLVPDGARAKVAQGLMRMLAGQGGRRATNSNITKDGRRLICDWYNTPIVDERGCIIGGASLVQDVTDRINAEAMLRDAKEAAEQMSRAKSEFLATMSHELRTPLNAVIGFSELIMREAFGTVGPRYVSYARDIHTSGTHLLDIINDILDLSKIEAGKLELSEEVVDLGRLIDTSLRLVQGRASEGGVRLTSTVPADLCLIRADARALKQILINLASNAIKFTPEGGTVTLGASVGAEGGLVLAVADTGIGMRPEDIPRALEPFSQIESSLTRRFEGTGLGLPLCKRLAELHGATLELTSAPGVGTTATVSFPAARSVPRHPRLAFQA